MHCVLVVAPQVIAQTVKLGFARNGILICIDLISLVPRLCYLRFGGIAVVAAIVLFG